MGDGKFIVQDVVVRFELEPNLLLSVVNREVKVEFRVRVDAVGRRLDNGVGDKGHVAHGISLYRERWQSKDISTPAEGIVERVDIPSEDSIKRATPATAVASDLIDTIFLYSSDRERSCVGKGNTPSRSSPTAYRPSRGNMVR